MPGNSDSRDGSGVNYLEQVSWTAVAAIGSTVPVQPISVLRCQLALNDLALTKQGLFPSVYSQVKKSGVSMLFRGAGSAAIKRAVNLAAISEVCRDIEPVLVTYNMPLPLYVTVFAATAGVVETSSTGFIEAFIETPKTNGVTPALPVRIKKGSVSLPFLTIRNSAFWFPYAYNSTVKDAGFWEMSKVYAGSSIAGACADIVYVQQNAGVKTTLSQVSKALPGSTACRAVLSLAGNQAIQCVEKSSELDLDGLWVASLLSRQASEASEEQCCFGNAASI